MAQLQCSSMNPNALRCCVLVAFLCCSTVSVSAGNIARYSVAAGTQNQPQNSTMTLSNAITTDNINGKMNELDSERTEEERSIADTLQDIFISVKTSLKFHQTRLPPVLDTWYTLAKNQTWFFTDHDDEELSRITDGHLVNTHCPATHHRKALCCKMAAEYDAFLASDKKWFCHFDDDNYVNTARLAELLAGYSADRPWYFGKNSIKNPIEIVDRDKSKERVSFWFGTGGAGFCVSRALALRMHPLVSSGRFKSIGEKIRLPDDVTMGYVIEELLKDRLTVIDEFHSHLEQMRFLSRDTLDQQISFSYSLYGADKNTLDLPTFPEHQDPTRFYSLHCLLHPSTDFCQEHRLPSHSR